MSETITDAELEAMRVEGEIQPHPYADVFPMLPEDELKELAADIKTNGLLQTITIFQDKILDGRNRLAACRLAEVKPRFERFTGDESAAWRFVYSANMSRRHLTLFSLGQAVLLFKPMLVWRAKEKEHARKTKTTCPELDLSSPPIDTVQELADAAGMSRSTFAKILAIKEAGVSPETEEKLRSGELSVDAVYNEIREAKKNAADAAKVKPLKPNAGTVRPELDKRQEPVNTAQESAALSVISQLQEVLSILPTVADLDEIEKLEDQGEKLKALAEVLRLCEEIQRAITIFTLHAECGLGEICAALPK